MSLAPSLLLAASTMICSENHSQKSRCEVFLYNLGLCHLLGTLISIPRIGP